MHFNAGKTALVVPVAPQHHRFDLGPATETPTPTGLGPPPGLHPPPGLGPPPGLTPNPNLNPAAPAFQPGSNMSAAQQLKDKLMNGEEASMMLGVLPRFTLLPERVSQHGLALF